MQNLKISALVLLMSSTALVAGPVEDMIAELEAMGYTDIESEAEGDLVEIEAEGPDGEREILINPVTGEILSDDVETDDDEDDDDEDEDDDDS